MRPIKLSDWYRESDRLLRQLVLRPPPELTADQRAQLADVYAYCRTQYISSLLKDYEPGEVDRILQTEAREEGFRQLKRVP